MKKIIEIHSYDYDWNNSTFVEKGPRYINSSAIIEIKSRRSGFTLVLYRSGREVKGFFTKEIAADLAGRINEEEKINGK